MVKRLLSALIVALGLTGIADREARAVVITVDSQSYQMTTVTGVAQGFDDLLMSQPWFGDFDLAGEFALALGDQLGTPNTFFIGAPIGPVFIDAFSPTGEWLVRFFEPTGVVSSRVTFFRNDVTAVAVAVALPVPASVTLMLVGLAGLGLAARRRRHESLRREAWWDKRGAVR